MKKKGEIKTCFYCNTIIAKDRLEMDHFPIPDDCGGTFTVPACQSCHDMKDRFTLESWIQSENGWIRAIINDFPSMSRETRIFLAKTMALYSRGIKNELRKPQATRPCP